MASRPSGTPRPRYNHPPPPILMPPGPLRGDPLHVICYDVLSSSLSLVFNGLSPTCPSSANGWLTSIGLFTVASHSSAFLTGSGRRTTKEGPPSPVMCCGGFPYPRSSSAFAADTLAAGAVLGLSIIDTSVSIALPVCLRASSFTSATTLGLPPGLRSHPRASPLGHSRVVTGDK